MPLLDQLRATTAATAGTVLHRAIRYTIDSSELRTVGRAALLITLLLTAVPAGAQADERRGFIGIGIGPALPFGTFADATGTNPREGRAFPGYTDTMLNLGYRRWGRIGIAGLFSYSEYVMRGGGDNDWWQVAGLTVGPMYTRPIGARGALDLKATVGLMALTPVIDEFTTGDGTGSGLNLDVRAAVRYDVFRRWAVFAEGGFQGANVSFPTGARTDVRTLVSGLGVAFRPVW
jgi:hypothetical protein